MADEYKNWQELVAAEPDAFRITYSIADSDTSHIAIHAGGIEAGSGEVAKAVATQTGHSLYCMEGIKAKDNGTLHITSTNFDEPTCVKIQRTATKTISYHGYSGDEQVTHIGGLDNALAQMVGRKLEAAGFTVDYNPGEDIAGAKESNIANRNKSGAGVQLELSAGQRKAFFPNGNSGAANRDDPSARTDVFHRYVGAVVSALPKPTSSYNRVKIWNGSKWVEGTKKIWDGSRWSTKPAVRVWDGQGWMFRYPDPIQYPSFVAANGAPKENSEYRTYKLPAGIRLGDFVVSVCVARDDMPQLLNPTLSMPQTKRLATGSWIACVVFQYDGAWGLRDGDSVRWGVPAGGDSTVANYVYRYADTMNIPVTPLQEIKEYKNVFEVPMNSPRGNTSLFAVVSESKNLSTVQFPEGLISRYSTGGKFGENQIRVHAADTPGSGASVGTAKLDTTVPAAAVVTIKIPGADDGLPTWILGDMAASVLGKTTYLQ
ncbi:poly-gamma-glutamate hydrolase family protein [Streptomyces sp. NPDC059994]|uniref:poly-gamma-glutamate hydrolase family protein n=1 Tax=Streptomyces sp. NPDC059994 TaxID=3347029 RepID=UPI00369C4843